MPPTTSFFEKVPKKPIIFLPYIKHKMGVDIGLLKFKLD